MHRIAIPCAFVMKARARRLFDDLAARQRGESLKQTRRELKEGRKRAKREWEGSKERPLMSPIFDDRRPQYEDYSERKISHWKAPTPRSAHQPDQAGAHDSGTASHMFDA